MTRNDHIRSSGKSNLHHKKEHHHGSGQGGFSASAFHSSGPAFHSASHQSHSSSGGGGGSHDVMDATFIWKLTKLGRIGSSRLRFDDDFADRLNYQFTGVLMFLFIGLIGIRQYVGKPIQCWVPQVFTRGWEEYAENYCWVSNTYFSPVDGRLPAERERISKQLGYYQWVPVMLAIQALLIYLPCLIWRLLMGYSGFNLRRIIQMACDSNLLLPEHTLKNVRFIARYMEGCIYRQRDYKRRLKGNPLTSSAYNSSQYAHFSNTNGIQGPAYGVPPPQYSTKTSNGTFKNEDANDSNNLIKKLRMKSTNSLKSFEKNEKVNAKMTEISVGALNGNAANGKTGRRAISKSDKRKLTLLFCGRKYGNYLTVLYFIVKVIYLGNIIGQMYLMEKFIGANESYYGITILRNFVQGKDWQMTGNFPRITFCDFNAKKLGENDRYSIQCVLPLNMFLEKIYIFLWFWYCLVGIVTLASFVSWFLRMGFAKRRIKFIRKYLKILCVMKETDKNATKKFVENYLRSDGVFIIRLIAINVGDFLAGDLVCELWHIYRHKQLQDLDDLKMTDSDLQGLMGITAENPQLMQQNSILKQKLTSQNSISSHLAQSNGVAKVGKPDNNRDLSNNDDSIV